MDAQLDHILKVMTRYQKNVAVTDEACRLLATLSGDSDSVCLKRALHEAGACTFILKAVETDVASNCLGQAFSAVESILSAIETPDEKEKGLQAVRDAMEGNIGNDEVKSQGQNLLDYFGKS